MEDKLTFKDLIEKYNEQIENFNEEIEKIDVETLQNEIQNNNSDVVRYEREESNLSLRVNDLKSELDKIEKIGLQYDVGSAKEECQNKIKEVEQLREKNNTKIEDLKKDNELKEKTIERFKNKDEEKKKIDEDIIKEAEDRTEEFNNKLLKQIEELNETIDKFGAGQKENRQYTKEEKVIIDRLKSEIDDKNKKIEKNNIMLKFFKENLGKHKSKTTNTKTAEPTKPEPTKPEPTKSEPIEPEPIKPEPTKSEPTEPEPIKTEPTKSEPIEPEPIRTEPTEPQGVSSGRKPEISRILICPITNTISYEIIDEKGIYGVGTEELDYTNEFVKGEYVKELLGDESFELSEEQIEDITGKVDPNILKVLEENDKEALNKYINSIVNSEEIPFDIEYDLKDMYKTDMLYNKEKSNLLKIAKKSEKLGAKISKDNILKRTFDRLKSLVSKQTRKKLVEDNKTYGKVWEEYEPKEVDSKEEEYKEDIIEDIETEKEDKEENVEEIEQEEDKKKEKSKPRHLKQKTKPRHYTKKKSILSKSKSLAASLGKKTVYKCKSIGKNTIKGIKSSKKVITAFGNAGKAFRDSFKTEVNHEEALKNHMENESKNQEKETENELDK